MTHFAEILAQVPVPNVGVESWEVAKGIMLTLSTMGVGYLVKAVRKMEFAVLELQREVFDKGGTNGLKRKAAKHEAEIGLIKERNEKIDAVAQYERDHYKGPERRDENRRLRNKEFPTPLDTDDN